MPVPEFELPDDLIDLQRALYAAQAAVEDYAAGVDAERAAQYPDPEQWRERSVWPEDGPERAELARLRAERDEALLAIRHHPRIVQAYADKEMPGFDFALKKAARAGAEA